jgi:integrase/recombinase XerD
MLVSSAVEMFLNHHKANSTASTLRNYTWLLSTFAERHADRELESIQADEILDFLNRTTEGKKRSTKRLRFTLLVAFFNFVRNTVDPNLHNPCSSPVLRKVFRGGRPAPWKIVEKEAIDEMIFRTPDPRDRLMLELMARGGLRVGEVLKLRVEDVQGQKLLLRTPKSGREAEAAFIPRKVAERLKDYIQTEKFEPGDRLFRVSYTTARLRTKAAGELIRIHLRPHDLRRHCATFASRCGTPIEIVSKVILRHTNLSTTQMYLGKVSDVEASRWIENLHG